MATRPAASVWADSAAKSSRVRLLILAGVLALLYALGMPLLESPVAMAAANQPPRLTVSTLVVAAGVYDSAFNSGTWADDDADLVTLTASNGTVTRRDDGYWSWSSDYPAELGTVVITATDKDGSTTMVFQVVPKVRLSGTIQNERWYGFTSPSWAGANIEVYDDFGKLVAATSTLPSLWEFSMELPQGRYGVRVSSHRSPLSRRVLLRAGESVGGRPHHIERRCPPRRCRPPDVLS